jgi:hypothetical protein
VRGLALLLASAGALAAEPGATEGTSRRLVRLLGQVKERLAEKSSLVESGQPAVRVDERIGTLIEELETLEADLAEREEPQEVAEDDSALPPPGASGVADAVAQAMADAARFMDRLAEIRAERRPPEAEGAESGDAVESGSAVDSGDVVESASAYEAANAG